MKRIEYFELISQISEFKTLTTPDGDELVVFKNLPIQDVDFVDDKTEFESSENHVHQRYTAIRVIMSPQLIFS